MPLATSEALALWAIFGALVGAPIGAVIGQVLLLSWYRRQDRKEREGK